MSRTQNRLERLATAQNQLCHLCELAVSVNERSLDHIIPKYLGGKGNVTNLKMAHRLCNNIRGYNPIQSPEYYREEYKKRKDWNNIDLSNFRFSNE